MALVTNKPENLPTTNTLDNIPDDINSREIRLGANVLLALDDWPQLGETRDIVLRLRCVRTGDEKLTADADSDITHFCGMKIVTAWQLGNPMPPNADEDQPGLFDGANAPDDADSGGGDGEAEY